MNDNKFVSRVAKLMTNFKTFPICNIFANASVPMHSRTTYVRINIPVRAKWDQRPERTITAEDLHRCTDKSRQIFLRSTSERNEISLFRALRIKRRAARARSKSPRRMYRHGGYNEPRENAGIFHKNLSRVQPRATSASRLKTARPRFAGGIV